MNAGKRHIKSNAFAKVCCKVCTSILSSFALASGHLSFLSLAPGFKGLVLIKKLASNRLKALLIHARIRVSARLGLSFPVPALPFVSCLATKGPRRSGGPLHSGALYSLERQGRGLDKGRAFVTAPGRLVACLLAFKSRLSIHDKKAPAFFLRACFVISESTRSLRLAYG